MAAGSGNQIKGINSGGTALEWKTLSGLNGITITHNIGAITIGNACPSDRRVKRNIRRYKPGLSTVLRLRPSIWEHKEESGLPQGTHVGFIAQDLKEEVPHAVEVGAFTKPDGSVIKDMHFIRSAGSLDPLLVNAVQELQVEMEEMRSQLQSEILNLQRQLVELRSKLK
jgi:hypothetical protein